MERNINIKIDIDDRAPTSYNDLIKVGDSINLTIDLLSKGESVDLKDSSVELFLKKEDGTKVEQEVIIGDSKVSCTPLNIQSTAAVGQVCGELVVESSGKQVTSSTFIFNVEGSTSSEVLEESKDDIATIKSLQNTIVNVNSVVEKYKTNIEAIAGTSESIEALAQIKIYAESAVTEIETVVNTGNTLKTSLESENTRAENNIQELNNLGSESIKTHINNTDIHVAASDKTKWDSYEQLISDNTSHLNENTQAIENIKEIETGNIDCLNGWNAAWTGVELKYERSGNLVHVFGIIQAGVTTGNTTIFILPYKPKNVFSVSGIEWGGKPYSITIGANKKAYVPTNDTLLSNTTGMRPIVDFSYICEEV